MSTNNINGQDATVDLQFDLGSLSKSAQEAEKIANKMATNIAKTINDKLSNLKIGIKKNDLNKLDELSQKLNKTSKALGDKLNVSLKGTTNAVSALNRQLTRLGGNLEKIKANSNINIKVSGNVRQYNAKSNTNKQQSNNNASYTPNWEYPNYFKTHAQQAKELPNYKEWEYKAGKTNWTFGEGGYGGYTKTTRKPNLQTIYALGWNGAIDAEWSYMNPRDHAKHYGTDNSGNNINDHDLLNTNYQEETKEKKKILDEEKKQQKKRKKAEDTFLSGMQKVAMQLTGIYGISSLTGKVGNVIKEGGALNLLSNYTGEEVSKIQLYNEAIKRTTHKDSYGQFESLRTRGLFTSLQSDPQMASILGMTADDVIKDPNKYKVTDVLDKIRGANISDDLKQAYLQNLGFDPSTALALTSKNFNKDLGHVADIGSFSQENVDNTKEILNLWEDIQQQAKLTAMDLIPTIKALLDLVKEITPILKPIAKITGSVVGSGAEIVHNALKGINNAIDDPLSLFLNADDNLQGDILQNKITKKPAKNNMSLMKNKNFDIASMIQAIENPSGNPLAHAHSVNQYGNPIDAYGTYQQQLSFAQQYDKSATIDKLYSPTYEKGLINKWYAKYAPQAVKDMGYSSLDEALSDKNRGNFLYYLYERYYHGRPVANFGKNGIAGIKKGIEPNLIGKEINNKHNNWEITHNVNVTGLPAGVDTQQVGDIFKQFMNQNTSDAVIAGAVSHY
jgi:hypothetical protein